MKLFNHQAEAARFIIKRNCIGAIYHEMGLGKTRTAIEIFNYKMGQDSQLKLLVVAPLSLLEAAWGEDIKTFRPNLRYWNIHDRGFPERDHQIDFHSVYLINYEALIQKKNLEKIAKLIKTRKFMIVCDESSKMKNHQTKSAKTLLALAKYFKYRIIMSGTPAPNIESEYWAQMTFLSPGILYKTFSEFRNRHFYLKNKYTHAEKQGQFMSRMEAHEMFKRGWGYEISQSSREDIVRKIQPYCHFARKKECMDLPERTDEIRVVEMGKDQRKIYNDMKRHLIMEINNEVIAVQAALTKIMKLRQVTSGFSYNEQGQACPIKGNPKMTELFQVIDEAGNQPLILWIQFRWELLTICHELYKRFGEKQVVTLYSGTKDRDESIRAFKESRARILVAHPRSAAHGLTFVNCSTQIFFSLDWSWEAYEQARARIHRAGQTKKCTYIHLVARDSIDERILDVLRGKGKAEEILFKLKGEKPWQ